MTELLLPGAGIPAIPEVSQPTRTSSAKSGSTDFSGILRRAAESLRQSGATEPGYRTSSLFSGSLPFADTNSPTTTENISIPVSRTESSLLSGDTIRVLTDPTAMAGGDVMSPDAVSALQADVGSIGAFSDTETGGVEVLQQMQDVLHTLAGLVTTLFGQNQEQSGVAATIPAGSPIGQAEDSIGIPTPHGPTEMSTGASSTIPVAADKSGQKPAIQAKDVLLPVVKVQGDIEPATANKTERVALPVTPDGEIRPEFNTQEAELPALSPKVHRENSASEPTPTSTSGIDKVEKDVLPPMPDTTIGRDVRTGAKTKTTETGIVEQPQTGANPGSEDNTDRLLIFVPSIGLVTIQPELAEDGTLNISVDVPRGVPSTSAALHNLLGDITGAVQNLLTKNEKTDGKSSMPPTVLNKQMGGGDTLVHQIVTTNEGVVSLAVPVPDTDNDSPNKVVLKTDGRDGVAAVTSEVVSVGVPEKVDQADGVQHLDIVQSKPISDQVSDPTQVVVDSQVSTTGPAENLSVSSNTSAVSTNIPDLASTVVVHQTDPFVAKVTKPEQSELSAQNSGKVPTPMSPSVENANVSLPSDISTADSLVKPAAKPEDSSNIAVPIQPETTSYPAIRTIHLTFTATPKQTANIPALKPDISGSQIPVASAPVSPLSDITTVSGDTSNDNDSLHEEFTGQKDILQPEVIDKEALPILDMASEIGSPKPFDTSIPVGKPMTKGAERQSAVPESNSNGWQASTPVWFPEEIVEHLTTQEAGIGDTEGKVQQEFVSVGELESGILTVMKDPISPEVVSNLAPTGDTPRVPSVAQSRISNFGVSTVIESVQPEVLSTPIPIGEAPIVHSEISGSDISMVMGDTEVDVSLAPVTVNVGSHPLQSEVSDGTQAFFPYIKPEQQPQEKVDLPQSEEPDILIPVAPEPEQSVLVADGERAGKILPTETTDTVVRPGVDISNFGMATKTDSSQPTTAEDNSKVGFSIRPVDVSDVIPAEANFVPVTVDSKRGATSADRIVDTGEPNDASVLVTPRKEAKAPTVDTTVPEPYNGVEPTNEPRIEGTTSKNNGAIGTAPLPVQPDKISAYDKKPAYDVVEPFPLRLQTNGDMVGLDTLLREAQHNGATVTRLSITMPQRISDMTAHSPKANSNQLDNTVSNNTIIEKVALPFLMSDQKESEGVDKPIKVHLSQNQEVSEPLSSISPISELREPSVSNIGTSIEELYDIQQDVREPVGSSQYRTLPQSEQPVGVFTQQVADETGRPANSFVSTGQPPVVTNEVNALQHPLGNDGVVQEREKISQKKGVDPALAKNGEYSIPQLQEVAQVAEKPILVQTGSRADVPQAVSGGNREMYTSSSLPTDRIPVPVVSDNVPATGQDDATGAMASASYHATMRQGTVVRTTAGRLSAARNAVESWRENTIPVAAGNERSEVVVSEPVIRANNERQEYSQTPFRQESQSQKNDVMSTRNERSMPVAGSESYQKVADHSTESAASEDVRNKNTIRPESIHPGIPLPMMPKITDPVVRMYRNVAQQEIPQVVQTAVRTFPSGSGGTIQMTLAPESLGEVLVAISVRDSVAEVRIDTETNESRKLVEAHLPALREKLTQAGLQVEHIEVRTKPQDTVQSDASRSGRQGSQTQEEQKSRQDFVRSFRHLASDEGREQPDLEIKRTTPYRIRGGNFERYA